MKRVFKILLICLMLVGCTRSVERNTYLKLVDKLENIQEFTEEVPFDIEIKLNQVIDNELSYKLIVDNVQVDIDDLEVLVIHDQKTSDIFPSIGIFDDEVSLKKDDVSTKGIILVGYIETDIPVEEFKAEFRVYLKYKIDNQVQIKYFLKQI